MKSFLWCCTLAVFAGMTCSAALAAPFSNGGFESPVAASPFTNIGATPTAIGAWTAVYVDHIGTYWPGSNGSGQSVDLNGLQPGLIWQEFDTVIGQEYEVTFDLSRNSDGPPAGQLQLGAAVYASLADFATALFGGPNNFIFADSFDTVPVGVTGNSAYSAAFWVPHSFRFTATQSTSVLVFGGDTNGTAYGPVIDNVNVAAVPEPASLAIWSLVGGATALAGWRRRKRLAKQAE